MDEIFLGSHISLSSPSYFLSASKQAYDLGENCFMFYSGAPSNSRRVDLGKMKIEEGKRFCLTHGIRLDKSVIHAPYIVNLAYSKNADALDFGIDFIKKEIERAKAFSIPNIVLHPGSRKDEDLESSLLCLASCLNKILEESEGPTICLETMAGKGNEVGRSFEELSFVLSKINYPSRVGICLDSCHIFDAGYDLNDLDGLLKEFDRTIGIGYLKVIHLNDSKNPRGSHKDRHENIGYGQIGFDALLSLAFHPKLRDIPKILETPYLGDKPPYKEEIAMLRRGKFIDFKR